MQTSGNISSQRQAHIETILVIGGSNGLGAWLMSRLWLKENGLEVSMADIEPPKTQPGRCTFYQLDYGSEDVAGLPEMQQFDLVVVAVPIPAIAQVATMILPQVRPGALVVDIASVKQRPIEIVERALPAGVGFIPTHPLFGTAVPSLVGQTVVVCPTACTRPDDLEWLRALLTRHGATVREMPATDHDSAMALVQVLTHFAALTVAFALAEEGADFRHALELLTPPFRALAGLVGRIVDIPPDGPGARLYADIQVADYPDAQRIRNAFERSAQRVNDLARKGDPDALAGEIERIAKYFPSDVLDTCKQLFAQSHASAQSEALQLHAHQVAGDLCAFKSTRHNRVVAGRVREFSATELKLEVCSTRPGDRDTTAKSDKGRTQEEPEQTASYRLAFDDESRTAAARVGFNIPAGRVDVLPRGDYNLMSAADFETWKAESLKPYRRDVTLVLPAQMDGRQVAHLLPRLTDGILETEVVSDYNPPDRSGKRCTMRLQIRGDFVPDRVVTELLQELLTVSITTPPLRWAA